MSLDSIYSFVHFSNHDQANYLESWRDYKIPYDDIDTSRLVEETANIFHSFVMDEEEDGAIPLNSSTFGAKVYKNRNLLKQKIWTDLDLDAFRSGSAVSRIPDSSILTSLHSLPNRNADITLCDFLSNGYNAPESGFSADISASSTSHDDIWLNTTSEFSANHTFSNLKLRSNSGSHPSTFHGVSAPPTQTPRIGKTRQPSQEKFQTPITRIMR